MILGRLEMYKCSTEIHKKALLKMEGRLSDLWLCHKVLVLGQNFEVPATFIDFICRLPKVLSFRSFIYSCNSSSHIS